MCIAITELGEKELSADLKESKRQFMRGLKLEPTPSGPAGPLIPVASHPRFEFIRESEVPVDIRYPPLDRFADEIRVLYILPHGGDPTMPIRCQMAHIPLGNVESGSGGYQSYEALSYMWETTEDKIPILVNGREFQITQNLHAALLQLRREINLKTVWADIICINQDDKLEKGRQIVRMAQVYEKAYCVDLWLGEAAYDSDLAIDFMNSLSGVFLERAEGEQYFSHKMRNISAELLELSEHEKAAWVAVYKLFRQPTSVGLGVSKNKSSRAITNVSYAATKQWSSGSQISTLIALPLTGITSDCSMISRPARSQIFSPSHRIPGS
jgi:hypothetical protein